MLVSNWWHDSVFLSESVRVSMAFFSQLLLEAGSDVMAADQDGVDALALAASLVRMHTCTAAQTSKLVIGGWHVSAECSAV